MPVTIRTATPDDASEVFRLIGELAVYEKLAHAVRADAAAVRAAMEADDPRIHVLLAESSQDAEVAAPPPGSASRAIGFALYFFTFSTFEGAPTLYLEDVFVEPAERGRGVGTMLLRRLARAARERGCRRMEWTALDWNVSARTFYENLGAKPMTSWIIHRLEADGIEAVSLDRP
jgi:GNAT superfamily N-acetyltransferase